MRSSLYTILAGALLILFGCENATPAADRERRAREDGDVLVGVVWPWAEYGEIRFAEGLELAVDEINASGGIAGRQLQLRRIDDHGSVNEALLIAQELGNDPEVMAVIGHLQSYVTVPASSIYDFSGLLLIAPAATDPELTAKGYERVFRSTVSDLATGRQVAELAHTRGYRRIAIYYVRNSYGRALANTFEEHAVELGISIVARASYDPAQSLDARTMEPLLRDWTGMELDAVFLAGEVPLATEVIVKMREGGMTVPILGSDAMNSPALITEGGAAVEGVIVPSPFHPDDPRPAARQFTQAFESRYGTFPDAGSALGYDAVHLLAAAMRSAGSPSPSAVAARLREFTSFEGATGRIEFDQRGDLVGRRLVPTVVRDGRFEFLKIAVDGDEPA